jgi:hypothetical protein
MNDNLLKKNIPLRTFHREDYVLEATEVSFLWEPPNEMDGRQGLRKGKRKSEKYK